MSRNDRATGVAVTAIVVISAASILILGVWMWGWPDSFAVYVNFPVQVHLLHDLGVFHIGVAIGLITALVQRDAIFVALVGFAAICAMHAGNHVMDMDLGGRHSDPYLIGAQALLAGIGAWLRLRQLRG